MALVFFPEFMQIFRSIFQKKFRPNRTAADDQGNGGGLIFVEIDLRNIWPIQTSWGSLGQDDYHNNT